MLLSLPSRNQRAPGLEAVLLPLGEGEGVPLFSVLQWPRPQPCFPHGDHSSMQAERHWRGPVTLPTTGIKLKEETLNGCEIQPRVQLGTSAHPRQRAFPTGSEA